MMSNSEGYREDLGAAQARITQLEEELKEVKERKAPELAAYRQSFNRIRNWTIIATSLVIVLAVAAWYSVAAARSDAERQTAEVRGRADAFKVEYEALKTMHHRLTRQVEEQRDALAQLRQESERTVVETPPVRVPASSTPAGSLSADMVAQRLALCQRLDITRAHLYVEGVITRRGFNASVQPNSTRRDELEPVSVQQAITVLLPDRSEVTIRRSLCLRISCSNETVNGALLSSNLAETDLWEEAFWAELRAGDIVGLTFNNLRDRNVVAVRTTGK